MDSLRFIQICFEMGRLSDVGDGCFESGWDSNSAIVRRLCDGEWRIHVAV